MCLDDLKHCFVTGRFDRVAVGSGRLDQLGSTLSLENSELMNELYQVGRLYVGQLVSAAARAGCVSKEAKNKKFVSIREISTTPVSSSFFESYHWTDLNYHKKTLAKKIRAR